MARIVIAMPGSAHVANVFLVYHVRNFACKAITETSQGEYLQEMVSSQLHFNG